MPKKKISVIMLVIITLVTITTLILLGFGAVSFKTDSDHKWEKLRKKVAVLADEISIGLVLPVWNLDSDQIPKVIESIMRDEEVFGIRLQLYNAVFTVYSRIRDSQWKIVSEDRGFDTSGLISEKRKVSFFEEDLGEVIVYGSKKFLDSELLGDLLSQIAMIFALDIMLILSIYLTLWQMILKPLKKVEQYAVSIGTASDKRIRIGEKQFTHEIESLNEYIEKMVVLLDARYAALAKSENNFRSLFENVPISVWQNDFSLIVAKLEELKKKGITDIEAYIAENPGQTIGLASLIQIKDLNHATIELLEAKDKSEILNDFPRVFTPQLIDAFTKGLISLWNRGSTLDAETTVQTMTGKELNVILKLQIMPGHEKDLSEVLITCIDITELKQAESQLSFQANLLDAVSDSIFLLDQEGNIKYVNQISYQKRGYTKEELLSMNIREIVDSKDSRFIDNGIKKIVGEGSAMYESVHKRKDGSSFETEVSARRVNVFGRDHILSSSRDITEKKRIERQLKQSEELYRALIETTNTGFVVLDIKGNVLDGNMEYVRLSGHSALSEITGRNVAEWTAESEKEKNENAISQAVKQGFIRNLEIDYIDRNGARTSIEINATVVETEGSVRILSLCRDISERKKAEEHDHIQHDLGISLSTLADLKEGIKLCFESALRISGMDCGGVYLYDRDAGIMSLSYKENLSQELVNSISHYPTDLPNSQALLSGQVIYRNDLMRHEEKVKAITTEGLRVIVFIPFSHEKKVIGCLMLASHTRNEISERSKNSLEFLAIQIGNSVARLQAEDELRKSEQKYKEMVELLPIGLIETDSSGAVKFANSQFMEYSGYAKEDFSGNNFKLAALITEQDRQKFEENVARILDNQDILKTHEYTVIRKDNSVFPIEMISMPILKDNEIIGMRSIVSNMTDKLRLESEIQKSAKLESLGVLAGGIAHDFNNIMTIIKADISLIYSILKPEKTDDLYEYLSETDKAVTRASFLTKQLLTFSKGGAPVKRIESIEDIISESAAFASRGSNSKCCFNFEKDLYLTEIDSGQIGQVIQNMVINSIQATPGGGRIDITVDNYDNNMYKNPVLEKSGKYLKIDITDNGIGINPENIRNIFDPYFSTKKEGSGLGLAVCHSIVSKHGGVIEVVSEPGKGTTFTIFLPANPKGKRTEKKEEIEEDILKNVRKVLLLDDEEHIRRVAAHILKNYNIKVEFAEEGTEAVELYKSAIAGNDPFDIVILDLTIPGGMGGKNTIAKLIEIDPNVKAVVMSGYSNDPVLSDYKKYGFKSFLIKPFDIQSILAAIKAADGS